MANRIRQYYLFDARLTPAEAEIWAHIEPEHLTPATEVRGRLTGPHCLYASTVEVAYSWRERSRRAEDVARPNIQVRAVIPEPSLWDPESPFLYRGFLELCERGQTLDRVEFLHGLRDFGVTPGGLRWNGRAFPLQGVECDHLTEAAAGRLRSDGSNLLLATSQNAANLCAITDRLGFLLLARVAGREGYHDLRPLAGHPSWLGCLLEEQWMDDPVIHIAVLIPGCSQE